MNILYIYGSRNPQRDYNDLNIEYNYMVEIKIFPVQDHDKDKKGRVNN